MNVKNYRIKTCYDMVYFSQNTQINIPQPTCESEVWDVLCDI